MLPYLLKRRLRHVRSITINNIPTLEKESGPGVVSFPSSFVVIETVKGQTIYVSEVQSGFVLNVKFNELPPLDDPTTRIVLKLIVKVPEESKLASLMEQNEWLAFKTFEINLNKLQSLRPDDIIEGYNAPLLEMSDGYYTLQDLSVVKIRDSEEGSLLHKRNMSNYRVVQSFSFNSVLKLNKLLEYKAQVMEDGFASSKRLEKIMKSQHTELCWLIKSIERYNRELESLIRQKRIDLEHLADSTKSRIQETKLSSNSGHQSLEDYYGTTYPDLIQTKNRLDSLRLRQLSRLVAIFEDTCLFSQDFGFVEVDTASTAPSLYDRTTLKLIDKDRVMGIATETNISNEALNTCLGYYLIFIQLIATKIYTIPLPYTLKYHGSTSVVGDNHLLYLSDGNTGKQSQKFLTAIDCFNVDVAQVIQRWEYHRSP